MKSGSINITLFDNTTGLCCGHLHMNCSAGDRSQFLNVRSQIIAAVVRNLSCVRCNTIDEHHAHSLADFVQIRTIY